MEWELCIRPAAQLGASSCTWHQHPQLSSACIPLCCAVPRSPPQVRLVSPAAGWQTMWRHALLPGEHALSVAAVRLRDQSTGATVPLLAVGAMLPAGGPRVV